MALWLACAVLFFEKNIPLACIYALVSSVFVCVFFIDLEHKIIFDRFQIILLALGIAAIFFDGQYGWLSHVIGGAVGFTVFYLVSFGFEKIYNKEGLGGGDVKLVGVAGLLLGWERLLLSMLLATVPAAIIMLIATRGRQGEDKQFPFAPFLVFGFSVSMFFGREIIELYLSMIGL